MILSRVKDTVLSLTFLDLPVLVSALIKIKKNQMFP